MRYANLKVTRILPFLFCIGCGVKGDPLPPEKPATLGRGEPSYKKASEDIVLPDLPEILIEQGDDEHIEDDDE